MDRQWGVSPMGARKSPETLARWARVLSVSEAGEDARAGCTAGCSIGALTLTRLVPLATLSRPAGEGWLAPSLLS